MKLGIYGYGNLGKGVELAIKKNKDIELAGIFSKRKNIQSITGEKIYHIDELMSFKDKIDVLVICAGSATELPILTKELVKDFNVIDSFDTHANIKEHFENVNKNAMEHKRIALISGGWDPGMFSIARLYADSILPESATYTFWGRGISQGHSDAIRHIKGVKDARQYTIPIDDAIKKVESGVKPNLTVHEKHRRLCYVVVEEGADKNEIERQIKNMPNYFADYDTEVNFITEEELKNEHSESPSGGVVITTGETGINDEHKHVIKYRLKLDSNPEFTSSVLCALSRAIYKMYKRGEVGCKTIFDIRPIDLSNKTNEEILHLL